MKGLADIETIIADAQSAWRPPPRLALNEWADEHFRLSAENSAQAGRWKTLPYQVGIMQAMSDPNVTQVSLMKSARIGYTLIVSAAIGYYVHHAPCSIICVQPTVDDAKDYSKETIAPMIRDVPVLRRIMRDEADEKGPRDSGNTIRGKSYPGGRLTLVGANSGAGLRRRSCKVAIMDEADAYPPSAGNDGDPIKLAIKRTEYFWDRKIFVGSTPLIAGLSRIEALFRQGDQRRFYVPCPECGHFDFFVFSERKEGGGHWMAWPEDQPELAHFVCSKNGCVIEHKHKRSMVERGEWRAGKDKEGNELPFTGHASFHIWSAYSFSPNATWPDIAREFLEAKKTAETLRTFVNTTLGETWQEAGEVPDWERLYIQREEYEIGTVPEGVMFLTNGVDVQKDRLIFETVGWSGRDKESWSIEQHVLPGDTAKPEVWRDLDVVLDRVYFNAIGVPFTIRKMCVDSGYNTQHVYAWVRGKDITRVAAVKGNASQHTITTQPTPVDVLVNGKRFARGIKLWSVGTDVAKSEIYGSLRLLPPTTDLEIFPPGFCHFPQYDREFFRQLTAEHLVTTKDRKGYQKHEWQVIPGRENHVLDARVYARAGASMLQIERLPQPERKRIDARAHLAKAPKPKDPGAGTSAQPPAPSQAQSPVVPRSDSRFLSRPGSGRAWLSKRR